MRSTILNWFDINNPLHLAAYHHLLDNEVWPEGFLPERMHFPAGWPYLLSTKIVRQLLEQREEMMNALLKLDGAFTVTQEVPEGPVITTLNANPNEIVGLIRSTLDPYLVILRARAKEARI